MNFKQYFLLEDKIKLNKEFVNEFRKEYLRVLRSVESFIDGDYRKLHQIENELRNFAHWLQDYVAQSVLRDFIIKIDMKQDVNPLKKEEKDEVFEAIYDMMDAVWELENEDFDVRFRSDKDEFRAATKKQIKRIRYYGRKLVHRLNDWVENWVEDGELSVGRKITYRNMRLIPGEGPGQRHEIAPTEERMERAYKDFQRAYDAIAQSPLSSVLNDPMNVFVTPRSRKMEAAHYEINPDRIILRGIAGKDAIIHEFGHRYYYREMETRSRRAWEDFYGGDIYEITEEQMKDILNYIRKRFEEMDFNDEGYWEEPDGEEFDWSTSQSAVEMFLDEYENRNSSKAIQRLKNEIPHINTDDVDEIIERLRSFWGEFHVGVPLMKHEVSDYGNTDPKEAFSETFLKYVLGKEIDSTVKYEFERASGI